MIRYYYGMTYTKSSSLLMAHEDSAWRSLPHFTQRAMCHLMNDRKVQRDGFESLDCC